MVDGWVHFLCNLLRTSDTKKLRCCSVRFQVPADHLLSASVMSAPAALAISKLTYPETEVPQISDEDYSQMEDMWGRLLRLASRQFGKFKKLRKWKSKNENKGIIWLRSLLFKMSSKSDQADEILPGLFSDEAFCGTFTEPYLYMFFMTFIHSGQKRIWLKPPAVEPQPPSSWWPTLRSTSWPSCASSPSSTLPWIGSVSEQALKGLVFRWERDSIIINT